MKPFEMPVSNFQGCESGRPVFILANGPSILQEDLSQLKDEVVIGMNASTILEDRFDFISKYYVLSDHRFINDPEKRQWATKRLNSLTHRFVRSEIRPVDDPDLKERTTYVRALSRDGFSSNFRMGFYYGCTTTMMALQLAWHLGTKEVYILGCDLRYPEENPRFYSERKSQLEDAFTSVQLKNIINAAKIFEKNGGRLVNCSEFSFLRPYLPFEDFSNVTKLRNN